MKNYHRHSRHSGFTLIEMMVAIAILMTMLTIILVPMRLGLDSFAAGKAKSETQGALGVTISQIEKDLNRAVVVFPNSDLAGVSAQPPYYGLKSDVVPTTDADKNKIISACSTDYVRISNPSRIDMILAKRDDSGNLINPITLGDTLVTYYPRRLDVSKPYDPIENPEVLFRSEIPFRDQIGTFINTNSGARNAEVGGARYPTDCSAAATSERATEWMGHNYYGEANLEPLSDRLPARSPAIDDLERSHTLAMPSSLGLVVTNGGCATDTCAPGALGLIPESTFTTSDTNGDGKIDRVNISLAFTSFDASSSNRLRNNQPVGLQMRASRTVDLPNIQ